MAKVRVYYERETGRVVEIEHRPDEDYADENLSREDLEGISTIVVSSDELDSVDFDELEVHEGRLRTVPGAGGASTEAQARVQELREMDKSALSDEEWLRLFREYTTLTGGF